MIGAGFWVPSSGGAVAQTSTPYTPQLKASSSFPTLGASGGAWGHYIKTGLLVQVWETYVIGGAGAGVGSGVLYVTPPTTIDASMPVSGASVPTTPGRSAIGSCYVNGGPANVLASVQLWQSDRVGFILNGAFLQHTNIDTSCNVSIEYRYLADS